MATDGARAAIFRRLLSHQLRATVRRLVAFSLYYSGLLWLQARRRLQGRAVVLMYHRVLPPDADSCSTEGIVVTPKTFAMHMAFLKRHFHPLSVQEFRDCLGDGCLPDRSCLVTFDDGWSDNVRFALPVLERFQVPATIFVATAFVGGSRPFWQEELTRLLVEAGCSANPDEAMLSEIGLRIDRHSTDAEIRLAAREVVTDLKDADLGDIDALRSRLLPRAQPSDPPAGRYGDDTFMNWGEACRLACHPLITVASHAHSHVPLPRLGRSGARLDLMQSLQEFCAHDVPTTDICAYPNGDHDQGTVAAAAESGFSLAFTTVPGSVGAGDDRLRLRRINIHEAATSTRPEFLCRLLGLF